MLWMRGLRGFEDEAQMHLIILLMGVRYECARLDPRQILLLYEIHFKSNLYCRPPSDRSAGGMEIDYLDALFIFSLTL